MAALDHLLTLDIGNTRAKAGVFLNNTLIAQQVILSVEDLRSLLTAYPITHSVFVAVGNPDPESLQLLASETVAMELTSDTALPFTNLYETPKTLGMDRVAGVAGAMQLFPQTPCLVIDAGTCITCDFVDEVAQYHGGSISPGIQMRLRAMHEFTRSLPLLTTPTALPQLIGSTTASAMFSGAINGAIAEINGIIEAYHSLYPSIQAVICGGDAALFGKHIKNNIFAAPDLVLYGLNKILLFNVEKGL